MTVQQTSILAFRSIDKPQHIGHDEMMVLRGYRDNPEYTDAMLAEKLGYTDPNKVRPRRFSLVEYGMLASAGKRRCAVSKKLALCWRITDKGYWTLWFYEHHRVEAN